MFNFQQKQPINVIKVFLSILQQWIYKHLNNKYYLLRQLRSKKNPAVVKTATVCIQKQFWNDNVQNLF